MRTAGRPWAPGRRAAAAGVLVALAAPACSGQRAPVEDLARPPVDPPAGHVQLLYGAAAPLETGDESRYVIFSASAAPDGTVYVVEDPTSPVAGAESENQQPRTVVVDSRTGQAGVLGGFTAGGDEVERPLVDAVGPDGSLYATAGRHSDGEPVRLYVRPPGGPWRREDGWPAEPCQTYLSSGPRAVGGDGTLYRVCDGRVLAWTAAGGERTVAGRLLDRNQPPPPVPARTEPRPAIGATLPYLVTVAPTPDGRLYVVSDDSVEVVEPDGTLRPVAGPGTDPGGILTTTILTAATMTADGSLLLYDQYLGRLLVLAPDGRMRQLAQGRPVRQDAGIEPDDAARRPLPVSETALSFGASSIAVLPDGDVLLPGGHRVLRLGDPR